MLKNILLSNKYEKREGMVNMIRNPVNTNQKLHVAESYGSLSVMYEKGPMIENYLGKLHGVLHAALLDYSRVFAFRVDLRLPEWMKGDDAQISSDIISKFVESFKAKIKHNRLCAKKQNPYAHDTVVRYVWARELGDHNHVHHHVAFMLNGDAFCALGNFILGNDNMFNRLNEAWASALGLSIEIALGLVHIPENASYHIRRGDHQSISEFFYRASYLCKANTKHYGNGHHGFGASRR